VELPELELLDEAAPLDEAELLLELELRLAIVQLRSSAKPIVPSLGVLAGASAPRGNCAQAATFWPVGGGGKPAKGAASETHDASQREMQPP
jgi:hypothetical protein